MLRKSIIEAKFTRSKAGCNKTMLWSDASHEVRHLVSTLIALSEDEEPVVIFFNSPNYVLLLTTQALIEIEDKVVSKYFYPSISTINLSDLMSGQTSKTDKVDLNLVLKSGDRARIMVERNTWYALYSIIKTLIASNGN